jgi:TM2 domain-containing membrane protein YozV
MIPESGQHSVLMAYVLWIFGFLGSHRFYVGRPVSGTIWFSTFGLFGVGWLVDLLLIPGMVEKASEKFPARGPYDYNIAWLLLTFLGMFGAHHFYLRHWGRGFIWLLTGGILGLGYLYDFWTLNQQVRAAELSKA